jgi:general nucleoside transport system ATP-binding protein
MRDGAINDFSVQENVFLHDHMDKEFRKGIFLDFKKPWRPTRKSSWENYGKDPHPRYAYKEPVGGQYSKADHGRELARKPSVLIAAQPTRGVDIGASEYIHQRLLMQRDAGTAILLSSEDLDELYDLSDRIAVIYEGTIMGVFLRQDTDIQALGLLMAGIRPGDAPKAEAPIASCEG